MKFKVGDMVKLIGNSAGSSNKTGFVGYVTDSDTFSGKIHYFVSKSNTKDYSEARWSLEADLELVVDEVYDNMPKPDGGPAKYYDVPVGVITLNDVIEWKGETSWGGDSFHLGNLLKAAWRWGIKDGTTKEYDARKFMYSGARLLMKYAGVASVRKTLQQMLDDPQFKDKS